MTIEFLAKNGANVNGGPIPTSSPTATYPITGTTTIGAKNTLILPYFIGGGLRKDDNTLLASIMVTSNQPIAVGQQMANGPLNAIPCNALQK